MKSKKSLFNKFDAGFENTFWNIFPYIFIPLWCVMFFGIIFFAIFAFLNPRVMGKHSAEFLAPIIEEIKK